MRIAILIAWFVSVLALGGCAGWRHEPSSCDGEDRRPLNRGLWDAAPRASATALGGCSAEQRG